MEQITDHDAWQEHVASKRREAGSASASTAGPEAQGPLGEPMSDEEAAELLNDPELFDPEWEHDAPEGPDD